MAVFRFGGWSGFSAAALLNHLGVIILPCRALGVPSSEVGDRHPGTHAGPEAGRASGHDERHMSAARAAHEVDTVRINAGVGLGVFHRVDDVLRGQVGGAGLRVVIDAAESRGDHHPTALLSQSDKHGPLFDTSAPAVEEDQQRYGRSGEILRRGVGLVIDDLLWRTVLGAGDVDRHLERYRFHLFGGRSLGGFSREERHAGKQGGDGLHLAEGRRWALI